MTKDLTKGSPMRLLLSFGIPILFGFLFQQLYNVVDTAIVGQTLGGNALAAVGSTSSINFLVVGFTTGVCGGFAIPIAQQCGARNDRELRRYVTGSLWLCIIVGLLLTAATVALCGNILTLMDTPQDIYHRAWLYIVTIFAGMPGYFLYNMCAGILRSLGDSRTPVIWLVAASLLNVVLDIVCIVTFHMDVFGAAFATIFSQYVAGFGCLVRLCRGFPVLKMEKGDWAWDGKRIRVLCSMGLPMGLQYSITAIGSILIQAAVNHLGTSYITAVTAASKVHLFLACPFDAMGSAMATYGGQNVGAQKWERLHQGTRACVLLGAVCSVVELGAMLLFSRQCAMLFLDPAEPELPLLVSLTSEYILINCAFFIPLALVNIVRFSIQGMGYSAFAILAGVLEMIARAGVAFFLVPALGYVAACFASPAAWICADLFLIPACMACIARLRRLAPSRQEAAPAPAQEELPAVH